MSTKTGNGWSTGCRSNTGPLLPLRLPEPSSGANSSGTLPHPRLTINKHVQYPAAPCRTFHLSPTRLPYHHLTQATHLPPLAQRPTPATSGTSQSSAPALAAPTQSPTPTPPPPTTQLSLPPGTFIMTAELLHTMVKDLTLMSATVFQHVTGVTVDMAAFEVVVDKLATKIVDQVTGKTQALTLKYQQQKTSPTPLPTQMSHGMPPATPPVLRTCRPDPPMRPAYPSPPTLLVSEDPASCASASGTAEVSAPTTLPSWKYAGGTKLTFSSSRRRFSQ